MPDRASGRPRRRTLAGLVSVDVGCLLVNTMRNGRVRRLDRAGEPDQVTFWIGEVADGEVCARVLLGAHPACPAEAFGLLQRGLDVGDADVKDRVARVAAPAADAARDPGAVAGGVPVGEPVVARLGDGRRDRPAGVELPPEQLAVVVAE